MKRALALLALAACGGKTAPPATPIAPADAAPPGPHFAWGSPCKIPVDEHDVLGDHDAVMHFTAEVATRGDGDYDVSLEDWQISVYDGNDTTGEYAKAWREKYLASVRAFSPRFAVSRDGALISVDVDTSKAIAPSVAMTTSLRWSSWVDAWATPSDDLPDEHGLVHRTASQTFEGESLKTLEHYLLDPFGLGDVADQVEGTIVATFAVDIAPMTLRPHDAQLDMSASLTLAGHDPRSLTMSQEDVFDWDHAVGCVIP